MSPKFAKTLQPVLTLALNVSLLIIVATTFVATLPALAA